MNNTFQVMWAQVDPNGHLRHSAYYDMAAQVRVNAFSELNLSINELAKLGVGPILFREEAKFKRELLLNEQVRVDLQVQKMHKNGYKWTIIHSFYKSDDSLAATVTVDGAWLDLKARKIAVPPEQLRNVLYAFPQTSDFELT